MYFFTQGMAKKLFYILKVKNGKTKNSKKNHLKKRKTEKKNIITDKSVDSNNVSSISFEARTTTQWGFARYVEAPRNWRIISKLAERGESGKELLSIVLNARDS